MPRLVAIALPAGAAWVDALRAVWDDGDAVLPVDGRLAPPARQALLDALAPAVVVGPDGAARRAGGASVADGDALVVATSGTTGDPKGAVLTHDAVRVSAVATSARLGVDADRHRWLACLPLCHVGGLSVVTRALLTRMALTVLDGFDAERVAAEADPATLVSLVATALARVDAGAFHTVVLGGSAPPATRPTNVVTTYGMTETGSGVVYDGVPLDGVEVRIAAGAGLPAPHVTGAGLPAPHVTGEILLRGPMLLRAYRGERGRESVPLDADGWLATGDAGRIDAGGRLQVDGRLSELIVTGGENVWPTPVEAVLRRHPGVAAVAVAGRPDAEWGQRVVAWVVPAAGVPVPTLEDLRGLVGDQLAAFAAPRELELVDALPTTAIGKLRRSQLR